MIPDSASSEPSLCCCANEGFQYFSLDHNTPSIRLIKVLPSRCRHGLIQCELSHASVDAKYTCVSYRWGDPDQNREINLNGARFIVWSNLYDLLDVLRRETHRDVEELYWIDAICLNQRNIVERHHQVAQMGKIYSRANYVIMWLGQIPGAMEDIIAELGDRRHIISRYDKRLIQQYIIKNKYFKRAWIVQEILVARSVMVRLGERSISLTSMMRDINQLGSTQASVHDANHSPLFNLLPGRQQQHCNGRLIFLLDQLRAMQCQHPRDRIFSLLTLSTGETVPIKVDYQVSEPILALRVLQQAPDLLCICSTIVVLEVLKIHPEQEPPSRVERMYSSYLEFEFQLARPTTTFAQDFYNSCQHLKSKLERLKTRSELDKPVPSEGLRYLMSRSSNMWPDDVNKTCYSGDFQYHPHPLKSGAYVVRIALWMIATLIKDRIDLCDRVRGKGPRCCNPFRNPRIVERFYDVEGNPTKVFRRIE